jgi:hypothetical protein
VCVHVPSSAQAHGGGGGTALLLQYSHLILYDSVQTSIGFSMLLIVLKVLTGCKLFQI